MAILSAANLATFASMLFVNRDKPDAPLAVADLSDTIAEIVTLHEATTTQLGDATHAINTTGKYTGKFVLNTTTNILQVAKGAEATDDWQPVTGATAVTPS